MGKKLRGRECGRDICQRKDGKYTADTHLYKLCDEANIQRFCMHALRHTYATQAIERGVMPKILQRLLGHSSIKTTMDRYVHVTDASLTVAIQQFEQAAILAD